MEAATRTQDQWVEGCLASLGSLLGVLAGCRSLCPVPGDDDLCVQLAMGNLLLAIWICLCGRKQGRYRGCTLPGEPANPTLSRLELLTESHPTIACHCPIPSLVFFWPALFPAVDTLPSI
jgi:hypothetical protein